MNPGGTKRASGDGNPGFTLIELLVVIVVIAVLLALLFPAVNGAIATSQGATCMTNQRKLVMSMLAYAADRDGYLIASYQTTYTNGRMWGQVMTAEEHDFLGFRNADNGSKLFDCPTKKGELNLSDGGKYDYGMNRFTAAKGKIGVEGEPTPNIRLIPTPSKIAYIMDSVGNFQAAPDLGENRLPDFRHNGKCNIAFFDGHVEARSPGKEPGMLPVKTDWSPGRLPWQSDETGFWVGVPR